MSAAMDTSQWRSVMEALDEVESRVPESDPNAPRVMDLLFRARMVAKGAIEVLEVPE